MSYLKKTRNQIHKSHKLRWDYTYYSCFTKGCATVLFSVFYLFPANMMIWCLKLEEIAFTTFWCFFGFCLRNSAVSPHLRGHYKLPYTINMELERHAKKVWENRCSSAPHKPIYHLYVLIVSLSLLDSIKNNLCPNNSVLLSLSYLFFFCVLSSHRMREQHRVVFTASTAKISCKNLAASKSMRINQSYSLLTLSTSFSDPSCLLP